MVGRVDLDPVDPVQVGAGEQDGTPLLGIALAGDEHPISAIVIGSRSPAEDVDPALAGDAGRSRRP